MGIDKFRRKAVFIGNITLSGGVYQGAGAAIKLGTTYATALSTATADTKFVTMYFKNTATSGDNRGMYLRLYLAGAGGGGEAFRCYTEIVGVAASTAHGAHISLGMGESTTKGSVTGLGVAIRATLGLPDAALASGGTYSALMSEIYSFGDDSDAGAVTELSFLRFVNGGTAGGKATVDDDAFLLVLDTGFTSGAAHVWYDHEFTAANGTETLKVKTPGGTRYLVLYDSR